MEKTSFSAKTKTAVKLYCKAEDSGRLALTKDVEKFAQEFGLVASTHTQQAKQKITKKWMGQRMSVMLSSHRRISEWRKLRVRNDKEGLW